MGYFHSKLGDYTGRWGKTSGISAIALVVSHTLRHDPTCVNVVAVFDRCVCTPSLDRELHVQAFTELEDQIRECFGRVVYTHKTHEKMADRCGDTLRRFKICQIVLNAITASGAFSMLFLDEFSLNFATALAAIASLIVSGYMKGFDPGGTSQKHRDAAASLWPIRESYLSLLTDLRMQRITTELAVTERDRLQGRLAAIYEGAPQTTSKAYADAQDALKNREDYTFSDAEIDKFVPASLRKRNT